MSIPLTLTVLERTININDALLFGLNIRYVIYHEQFSLFPLSTSSTFSKIPPACPLWSHPSHKLPLTEALRTILAAELYYRTLLKFYFFYNILKSDPVKSGKY